MKLGGVGVRDIRTGKQAVKSRFGLVVGDLAQSCVTLSGLRNESSYICLRLL